MIDVSGLQRSMAEEQTLPEFVGVGQLAGRNGAENDASR